MRGPWAKAAAIDYLMEAAAPLVLGAASFLSVRAGLALGFGRGSPTFWPAAAVLLGALLVASPRVWWRFVVAAFAAHVAASASAGGAVWLAMGFALNNSLESLVTAVIVRRAVGGVPTFAGLQELVVLGIAAAAGALVSTAGGSAVLALAGVESGPTRSTVWFLGHLLAALTVTPVIVIGTQSGRQWLRSSACGRLAEAGVLALGLALVGLPVFRYGADASRLAALLYAPFPLLLWAAVRLGLAGTSAAMLGVTVLSVWSTVRGHGPFTTGSPLVDMTYLQLFLVIVSLPLMLLAVLIQERTRAQDAARESHQRYEALVNSVEGIVWEADPATFQFSFVTRSAERLLGYPVERWLAEPSFLSDHIHADDRDEILASCARATAEGRYHELEYRFVAADGRVVWLRDLVTVVVEDGRPVKLRGIMVDVTERKRAEDAVRESEAKLQAILDNTPAAVYAKDSRGRYILANRRVEALVGVCKDELLGRTVHDWQPGENADRMAAIDRAVLETGRPVEVEDVLQTRDGPRAYLTMKFPLRTRDGALYGVCGISTDITERKRAEAAIREREERFRIMADHAPVVVWMTDASGLTTFVNKPALDFTGQSSEELLGAGWRAGVHPDDLPRVMAESRAAIRAGRKFSFELRMRRRDGQWRWVLDRGVPMVTAEGTVTGYIGTCLDITERKQAEEARHKTEENLRLLLETTSAVPWQADMATWRFTYVGPQATALLGYPIEQWYEPDFWTAHIHPADRARAVEFCRAASADRERFQFEYRMVSAGGETVWIDDIVSVVHEEGVPRALRGFMIDVTERKRAEEVLQQLTARVLQSQDEERRRIARELHDGTAQSLFAITLNIARLHNLGVALDEKAASLIRESLELGEQCLQEIRTLSYLLHPPLLDGPGLLPALRWYVDGFTKRSGVAVELVAPPGMERLPAEVERALFRIVQECLTNIHRHSGSRTATIELGLDAEAVRLRVSDRGAGMGARAFADGSDRIESLGVGIPGMRERLHQLGGRLEIASERDGTVVSAVVPRHGAGA